MPSKRKAHPHLIRSTRLADTFASANLLSKINLLAADSSVHGVPIDLDTTATITGGLLLRDAYTLWNSTPANQQNPQYANYVARAYTAAP